MAGNEAAVMLGDYLIARSFHLCSQIDDQSTALRVGEVTSQVCEGEILQLANRGKWSMDERTYFEIIERKTAALIAVGCELGAAVSGASRETASALWRFGLAIGKAFQVQDDLLDLTASQAAIGKPVGRDAEKGKPTLAIIRYLDGLDAEARPDAIRAIESGDPNVAGTLRDAGAIDSARHTAQAIIEEAKGELARLPQTPARDQLSAMADAVVDRDR
jgi:octaprenyl-diphosphate synthase